MEPLPSEDLGALSDERLTALARSLEARRPPAQAPSAGVRPSRLPWSYRDIRRLEAVCAELARRAGTGSTPDEAPAPEGGAAADGGPGLGEVAAP